MHKASLKDFILLIALAAIWGSAFFNIKIASADYTPMALAFGRIFFAALVMIIYCLIRGIHMEAFWGKLVLVCNYWVSEFSTSFFLYLIWYCQSAKQYGGYFNVDRSYFCSDPEPSFYP
jgi:drug/metabolite transporter (DMT)-like permease